MQRHAFLVRGHVGDGAAADYPLRSIFDRHEQIPLLGPTPRQRLKVCCVVCVRASLACVSRTTGPQQHVFALVALGDLGRYPLEGCMFQLLDQRKCKIVWCAAVA